MKEKRKRIISVVALILIVVLIVTATYAYFAAQTSEGSSTDINITAGTVDNLTFETGEAISINATQTNFASGMTSLSDDTYAKATLVANNDTNSASANYYVQVYIGGNTFEYTTADETAELLLVVTDPSGSAVTSLSGLNYTTVTDGKGEKVSGFDITTYNGIITIADEYEITSTGTTTQEWTIEVIFVNLSTDQSSNAGASLTGSVYIGVDKTAYHEVCNDNSLSCTVAKLTTTSSSNLYYHAEDVSNDNKDSAYSYGTCYYNGEEVSSYSGNTITESDCSNVYKVTDTVYSEDSVEYYSDELMNMYLYNDPVEVSWDGNSCVIESLSGTTYYLYTWYNYTPTEAECTGVAYQWSDGSYYYLGFELVGNGEWIEDNATLGAQDNSYRYSGANSEVNNYVCFGSDEETCPSENLYRIIGAFQNDAGEYQIKLIMADYATSSLLGKDGDYTTSTYSASSYSGYTGSLTKINRYGWNNKNYSTAYSATGYYNVWSYSQLNTVNLNTNYWNTLESKWQDMVATTIWKVGGNTYETINRSPQNAKIAYKNEIINYNTSQVDYIYTAKVGLMYVSDYYYSSSSSYWSYPGWTSVNFPNSNGYYGYGYDYSTSISANWLYLGLSEWTITRTSSDSIYVYGISNDGTMQSYIASGAVSLRPTFYLNSSVQYSNGSGTIDDPIILVTE